MCSLTRGAIRSHLCSSVATLFLLAGSLGCEGPRPEPPLENATLNAGLDPRNPRILALVDYFEAHGVELVHDSAGWWRVTRPAPPEFDVIVSLRSFPPASAYQMRDALARINLAYLLNADARLAMSYPSLRGAPPGAIVDVRTRDLQARLERLFQAYRPASPPDDPIRSHSAWEGSQ